MPRGIPRKKEVVRVPEAVVPAVVETPKVEAVKKAHVEQLAPGQKYFETPEGEILIGEASADRLWSRKMNGGKGGWCNPKR